MTNHIKQTIYLLLIVFCIPIESNAFSLELNVGNMLNSMSQESAAAKKEKEAAKIKLREDAKQSISEAQELSSTAQNIVPEAELLKQEKSMKKLQKLIKSNYSSDKKIKKQLEELQAINIKISSAVQKEEKAKAAEQQRILEAKQEEERLKALSIANAAGFATIDEYDLAQKAKADIIFKEDFERKDSIRRVNLKAFFKEYPVSLNYRSIISGDKLDIDVLIEDLKAQNPLATTSLIAALIVANRSLNGVQFGYCDTEDMYSTCSLALCIAEEINKPVLRESYSISKAMLDPSINRRSETEFTAYSELPVHKLKTDTNQCNQDLKRYTTILDQEKKSLTKKKKDALLIEANNAGFSSIARYKRHLARQPKHTKTKKVNDEELVAAYTLYIQFKAIYEAHKNKDYQTINSKQLASAKEAVETIQRYYKSKNINTDLAWKKASQASQAQVNQINELNAADALPVTFETQQAAAAGVLLLIKEAKKLSNKKDTVMKKDF